MTNWRTWRQQLQYNGQRRLLVLAGTQEWAIEQAHHLMPHSGSCQLWLGEQAPATHSKALATNKFKNALGQEYDSLIFNAFSGLHPDALGATAGTLKAGGVMLLLCPPLAQWPDYADPDLTRYVAQAEQALALDSRFLRRFIRELQHNKQVIIWHQGQPFPALPALLQPLNSPQGCSQQAWQPVRDTKGCLNRQQRHALANILHCARTRTHMVLTADRGRGKSSLLGLAAQRLLQSGLTVLLSASNQDAPAQAFKHCASPLRFMAPDALLSEQPTADILLIDEAAAIPVPMLVTLAQRYCCIFASTEHGYEGTGLGFQLKFQPKLNELSPHWRKVHLHTPARWSPQDSLEPLIFNLLALNAEPQSPRGLTKSGLKTQWISRATLLDNDALLQQLFGLLTLAHYQTRPSDLRHLLDAPNLLLAVTFQGNLPIAVALLCAEGPLSAALSQGVWRGQRRPRGHLLPQSLAFHGGLATATQYSYYRIMRIVVHPHSQQQGLGSQLLAWLQQHLPQKTHCDFIGTSFGASPSLLTFWQNNGFKALRLGQSRDGVSGLHAIMMLWPCSASAQQILFDWQGQFSANLQAYRQGIWPRALTPIYQQLSLAPATYSAQQDRLIAHDFAFFHRDLLCDQPALLRFIKRQPWPNKLTINQQNILTALLTPGANPSQVATHYGLSGYKTAISQSRNIMQHFFKAPSEP
ncbi:tRNA(Met) cytidine acetyltransferase [Oceanisphaera sp. DM8]|uniref:tRNA(Met) cytidine acetyltransferase TmcA n=1 Tax=Oceanisphaera pacifica TaxID=2818389 RepID=A0ABS3NF47_9GAMM|nr:tRNA(Met) cytidine acetyltransferase [Oceanisphaera pacifica]